MAKPNDVYIEQLNLDLSIQNNMEAFPLLFLKSMEILRNFFPTFFFLSSVSAFG